jgi:antitoxin MazE
MITRIQKWGNSLGLRIPRALAEDVEVGEGSSVDVSVRRGSLVVRPVKRQEYRLEDLLAGVKPSNLHEEVEVSGPVGGEAW